MQPGFVWSQLDCRFIFGYRVYMAFGAGVGFRQKLADPPRLRIRFEHPRVAVIGDEQMCPAAMVEYVDVIRRQFCSSVERIRSALSVALLQFGHPHPTPGRYLFWGGGGLLA